MSSVQKIDLGLTGYDELFMSDDSRAENKLPKIYDIPLSEIDDFPGHPFRGNQHVSGKGKVSRSRKAHAATLHANEKGTRSAHARASAAHAKAAEYHGKRGNAKAEKAAISHARPAGREAKERSRRRPRPSPFRRESHRGSG